MSPAPMIATLKTTTFTVPRSVSPSSLSCFTLAPITSCSLGHRTEFPSLCTGKTRCNQRQGDRLVLACLPSPSSPSSPPSPPKTRLFVSGLSFRTTEESLRNAFKDFGNLIEINLVMDRIANRPRGFAFIRYATEEESQKAIEGMHGKFLDGRVIFVEPAKPRSEFRQGQTRRNRRQF